MRIVFIGPPFGETALMGVGVVKPGEVIDCPQDIADNLIKEGRAAEVVTKVASTKFSIKSKVKPTTQAQENS